MLRNTTFETISLMLSKIQIFLEYQPNLLGSFLVSFVCTKLHSLIGQGVTATTECWETQTASIPSRPSLVRTAHGIERLVSLEPDTEH